MTFHNRSRVTLLALTALLAGCNDKQAYQPLPPAEVRITQPVQRNVTRYLEMTGQTAAAKTDRRSRRPRPGHLDRNPL